MDTIRMHRSFWGLAGALALVVAGACGGKSSSGNANNNNTVEPLCGNGLQEAGELCDGSDLAGATCASLNLGEGDLACDEGCLFDVGGCSIQAECGNSEIEYPETCDGTNLGSATCESLGFLGGTLACGETCDFDISGCETCGNDVIDGQEQCDGPDLGGATCESLELGEGDLACTDACIFDVSGCSIQAWCGNGVADPEEDCDGEDLAGKDCVSQGFDAGSLGCTEACLFDTTACYSCADGDETPPEASGHVPAPETLGAPADTLISVDLFDSCDIVLDSITLGLTICSAGSICLPAIVPVTPEITGTGTNVTVTYQHPTDFPAGGHVIVYLTAEDASGNLLEETWRFSIRDRFVLGTSSSSVTPFVNAIDEASPDDNLSSGESFTLNGTGGSQVRMIIRFAPEVPAGDILSARLDLGVCPGPPPGTPGTKHVDCYRLNVDSIGNQATWVLRKTVPEDTAWGLPGASEVPADRQGASSATVVATGAAVYTYLSDDVLSLVSDWQGGAGYHGILCQVRQADIVTLCSTHSNYPPLIVGEYGPPLP